MDLGSIRFVNLDLIRKSSSSLLFIRVLLSKLKINKLRTMEIKPKKKCMILLSNNSQVDLFDLINFVILSMKQSEILFKEN
jgi:hypothetical protein